LPGSYNRLREGIERFFITDINNPAASSSAQSELFVMWDSWADNAGNAPPSMWPTWIVDELPGNSIGYYNHVPGGSNVLFMDGHVEFIKYNDKAPISTQSGGNSKALGWWMYLYGGYG
jgi:prepilin-type processing-associated H-X9-DG protein